jgi:hypothetical protein
MGISSLCASHERSSSNSGPGSIFAGESPRSSGSSLKGSADPARAGDFEPELFDNCIGRKRDVGGVVLA